GGRVRQRAGRPPCLRAQGRAARLGRRPGAGTAPGGAPGDAPRRPSPPGGAADGGGAGGVAGLAGGSPDAGDHRRRTAALGGRDGDAPGQGRLRAAGGAPDAHREQRAGGGARVESAPMADVLTTDEARVRWITLNRPETRNALTTQVNDAVRAAVDSAPGAGARVVVITGAGGAFSSGLDLRVAAEEGMDPSTIESRMRIHFHGLIRAIPPCPLPTIALADGPAAGAARDLALACELRPL